MNIMCDTHVMLYVQLIDGTRYCISMLLLLSTHSHDLGESVIPACGPPASFSVHLASSAVTPAGYVHKSRGDNVGAVEEMMCVECGSVTEGYSSDWCVLASTLSKYDLRKSGL